jgi:Domain of unknown function (DUF4268)
LKKPLGKLEKVNLRDVWNGESSDFTPWLAEEENIRLLGEAIGLELAVEAVEKSVGPFSADILCKDTATDSWVVIENQLEKTDHSHLGQILTYAAGLEASTLIWVAQRFTEEHRAAIDWLNERTDENVQFFAVEIEAWQIGNSPVAPKFNIVCKPNDWHRIISERSSKLSKDEFSDDKQLQYEFWIGFKEFLAERNSPLKPGKPAARNWMSFGIGTSLMHLSAVASFYDYEEKTFNNQVLRAELVLNNVNAKDTFDFLSEKKAEIENRFGAQLIWYKPEEKQMCRIFLRKVIDLRNKIDWPNQYEWLRGNLEKLRIVFMPLADEAAKRIEKLREDF